MDYEKKYKEALERARAYFENENYAEMADVFPELRESEDERTRKEMLEDIIVFVSGYADKRVVAKWVSFLKSLHPVKQEWSEEDERILKGIIGKIDHDQTYGVSKVEMLSFLKFLRPQPKQEWNKEDEEIRDNIICILQKDVTYTPPTRPNSCTGSGNAFYTHQTEIDWLKSLRPSWKPREVCYGQKGDPDPAGVWKPSEEQEEPEYYQHFDPDC